MTHFFEHHYLIFLGFLFFMAMLSGFIDAIAGGGGLISMPALMYSGMPLTMVLGTSKFQGIFSLISASYKYYKNGMINFSMIYRGLISGVIGAAGGALLANYISNSFMRWIVPFLLLFIFIINLLSKSFGLTPGRKILNETVFFTLFGFIYHSPMNLRY
jgi:uncharacterized membrane protein YfcA